MNIEAESELEADSSNPHSANISASDSDNTDTEISTDLNPIAVAAYRQRILAEYKQKQLDNHSNNDTDTDIDTTNTSNTTTNTNTTTVSTVINTDLLLSPSKRVHFHTELLSSAAIGSSDYQLRSPVAVKESIVYQTDIESEQLQKQLILAQKQLEAAAIINTINTITEPTAAAAAVNSNLQLITAVNSPRKLSITVESDVESDTETVTVLPTVPVSAAISAVSVSVSVFSSAATVPIISPTGSDVFVVNFVTGTESNHQSPKLTVETVKAAAATAATAPAQSQSQSQSLSLSELESESYNHHPYNQQYNHQYEYVNKNNINSLKAAIIATDSDNDSDTDINTNTAVAVTAAVPFQSQRQHPHQRQYPSIDIVAPSVVSDINSDGDDNSVASITDLRNRIIKQQSQSQAQQPHQQQHYQQSNRFKSPYQPQQQMYQQKQPQSDYDDYNPQPEPYSQSNYSKYNHSNQQYQHSNQQYYDEPEPEFDPKYDEQYQYQNQNQNEVIESDADADLDQSPEYFQAESELEPDSASVLPEYSSDPDRSDYYNNDINDHQLLYEQKYSDQYYQQNQYNQQQNQLQPQQQQQQPQQQSQNKSSNQSVSIKPKSALKQPTIVQSASNSDSRYQLPSDKYRERISTEISIDSDYEIEITRRDESGSIVNSIADQFKSKPKSKSKSKQSSSIIEPDIIIPNLFQSNSLPKPKPNQHQQQHRYQHQQLNNPKSISGSSAQYLIPHNQAISIETANNLLPVQQQLDKLAQLKRESDQLQLELESKAIVTGPASASIHQLKNTNRIRNPNSNRTALIELNNNNNSDINIINRQPQLFPVPFYSPTNITPPLNNTIINPIISAPNAADYNPIQFNSISTPAPALAPAAAVQSINNPINPIPLANNYYNPTLIQHTATATATAPTPIHQSQYIEPINPFQPNYISQQQYQQQFNYPQLQQQHQPQYYPTSQFQPPIDYHLSNQSSSANITSTDNRATDNYSNTTSQSSLSQYSTTNNNSTADNSDNSDDDDSSYSDSSTVTNSRNISGSSSVNSLNQYFRSSDNSKLVSDASTASIPMNPQLLFKLQQQNQKYRDRQQQQIQSQSQSHNRYNSTILSNNNYFPISTNIANVQSYINEQRLTPAEIQLRANNNNNNNNRFKQQQQQQPQHQHQQPHRIIRYNQPIHSRPGWNSTVTLPLSKPVIKTEPRIRGNQSNQPRPGSAAAIRAQLPFKMPGPAIAAGGRTARVQQQQQQQPQSHSHSWYESTGDDRFQSSSTASQRQLLYVTNT